METSAPAPPMAKAIWLVLPPGAAQRSRIFSPGCASSTEAETMALASCK